MSRHHGLLVCIFLATSAAAVAACGDDDDAPAGTSATGGSGGNKPVQGAGGTGGTGGAAGTGGAGGGASGTGGAGGGASGSAGAGGEAGGSGGAGGDAGGAGAAAFDPQRPPTDPEALKDWVIARPFDNWNCKTTTYDDGSSTRNCTNDLLSNTTLAEGEEWPEGIAGVVEARDPNGFISDPGLILSLKTKPKSEGGANWLWHHQLGDEVLETGFGPGGAIQVCNDCHITGTPDATPRDFVFNPIAPTPSGSASTASGSRAGGRFHR